MAFDKRKALQAALTFTQQGRFDKAIAEYQNILKVDPNDPNALNTIGDLYARTGNRAEAISHYMRLGDIYRQEGFSAKATAVYKKVIKLDPGNLQAQIQCADLYAEQGLVGEAKQQLLLIAERYSRAGDAKEALAVYQKIITLDPGNVAAANKLSELLARQGMGREAYTHLARSAEQCLAAGQSAEAQNIFRRMLQLNPNSFEAHFGLGRLLAKTGSPEAVQELKAAAGLAPDDAGQWTALGDSFREARDPKRAQEAYNKVLRLDGSRWEIRLRLAAVAAEQGDVARATEEIRQASGPAAQAGKGQELARLLKSLVARSPGETRYRMALVELLKGLDDKAGLVEAYRELAQVLEKQGKRAETQEVIRNLQALDAQALGPIGLGTTPPIARAPDGAGGDTEGIILDLTEAEQEGGPEVGADAREAEQVLVEIVGHGEAGPAAGLIELGAGLGETAPPDVVDESRISDELAKAEVYLKYGLVDKAIDHLQHALTLTPRHLGARQRLKRIYLDRNLVGQAVREGLHIASILVSQGDRPRAQEELEACIQLDPGSVEARGALERLVGPALPSHEERPPPEPSTPPITTRIMKPAEAVETEPLEEVLELPEPLAGGTVAEELAEADFFLQQGMEEEARGVLQRILSADPANAEAHRRLSGLEAAQTPTVSSEISFADLGAELETAGEARTERIAEPTLAEEVPVDRVPAAPPPRSARPARLAGPPSPAADVTPVFKVALDEDPGEGGYVDLGAELTAEIDTSQAVRDSAPLLTEFLQELQKGIREQFSPEDYETHYNLGIAYKEMELYDEAIEEFRLAAKEPQRALTCMNLVGLCFLAKGDPGRAAAELEKALTLPGIRGEEGWGLRYDLATAYEGVGEAGKAHTLLSALQEEAPRFRDVKARVRDLKARLKEPPPAASTRDSVGRTPEPPPPSPPPAAPVPEQVPQRTGKSSKKISFI